jgi:two-component sensor histidine kinase
VRANPIFDEAGDIQEWVGVHTDITGRRAAEEALRKLNDQLNDRIFEERVLNAQLLEQSAALVNAQESLRTIFNASSEGLALCRLIRDDEGRVLDYQVLDVNPAHLVLCSVPREQMLAKPVSQIAPPIDPRWMITAERAVETGEVQSFEVRNRFNGLWLDIHVSPVAGDLFAQTFIDVTARHEAEEQRARLIAEMNHRVMNNFQIVAGILGLQARRSQNPDVKEQLTKAVGRVHLLAELHEKLAFAPETAQVSFAAYLGAVCDRLRASIDEPDRVHLTLEAEAATLDVTIALPLGLIVNELVTNAVKYAFPAPSEGEISVSFRQEGESFLLRVADNGGGLPANVETKGVGLGMKLVSSFVDQIKGTMDVRYISGVEYMIRFPILTN